MNIPNTTLITACYNLSKTTPFGHTSEQLLQQNVYMIIYTDNSLFELIKEKRHSYGFDHITKYNVIEFEQLPYYYLIDKITESQILKITQLFFCLNSINTNPFNTDKFAWFSSNNFEKCNYTDNILQYIFNNISNNFHIQVQNVVSKNILCDDFYTFGKQIGIKIINKLIQNFENTKPDAGDFNIIEIIDEYYNDYKLSYGDYQNVFENFIQTTSNFDYIHNFIIKKYLTLKYHKEGYNCCKFILSNPKLDTYKSYYFNILFSYFIFSYYYNPTESLLIYKSIYKNSLINPQYLTNQSFYDTQLDFVKYRKNKSYKIIINVFGCPTIEKYKNEILKINQTFYKDAVDNNVKIIYFFGEEKVPEFVNTNENDPTYVYLDNVANDYLSASYKQERGLQYIFENYTFDYVLTIGTDTFVHIKCLLEYLKTLNPSDLLYIGGHGTNRKITEDLTLFFFAGSGFIITYNLLGKLYPKLFNMTNDWINICNKNNIRYLIPGCDVAISYYIHKIHYVKLIYSDKFFNCNYLGFIGKYKCIYKGYPDNEPNCHSKSNNINNILLCHYMTPTDFDNFYNLIHN